MSVETALFLKRYHTYWQLVFCRTWWNDHFFQAVWRQSGDLGTMSPLLPILYLLFIELKCPSVEKGNLSSQCLWYTVYGACFIFAIYPGLFLSETTVVYSANQMKTSSIRNRRGKNWKHLWLAKDVYYNSQLWAEPKGFGHSHQNPSIYCHWIITFIYDTL